ncbi:hypothetical protein PCANC_05952 [Puccinia coronata f. sp. avenae]|uniref:Uncharacterized protein n=1 Tax=Puccinia coronata f. sp. avenae TaxID=200324 RepID=A0A2N5VY22_9BASI|nr:hypothetical protein PCANC_05952 [Puccinia coronata f. sp. avenae]
MGRRPANPKRVPSKILESSLIPNNLQGFEDQIFGQSKFPKERSRMNWVLPGLQVFASLKAKTATADFPVQMM